MSRKHRWEFCDLCEINVVICGTCGNNTCNGGYGEVDGAKCPDCPTAYDEWQAQPEKAAGPMVEQD